MFLKTLTLKGFKSFADTTSLDLEPGRHRGGRAQRQRQVQRGRRHRLGARRPGARARCAPRRWTTSSSPAPPSAARSGRAEVSLTIDNTVGLLPIEFTEVTSPARCSAAATASTPSTACRAGCSTSRSCCRDSGRRPPAARDRQPGPDRRGAQRPARGSAGDHRGGGRRPEVPPAQGDAAERRLAATEGNLTRLQDLLREVRRQLRPLERQADAARRHGDVVAELTRAAHPRGRPRAGLAAHPPGDGGRASAASWQPDRARRCGRAWPSSTR